MNSPSPLSAAIAMGGAGGAHWTGLRALVSGGSMRKIELRQAASGRTAGGTMDHATFRMIGQAMLVAGALGLAGTAVSVLRRKLQRANLAQASGTVVEVVSRTLTPGNPYYHPVIEFRAANGKAVRFESPLGSYPRKPKVGEKVAVLYDRSAPDGAQVNSLAAQWFTTFVFGGLALIACLLGAMLAALSASQA